MKLAVAGDWHGNMPWALQAVDAAHEAGCKIILQCGDLGLGMPNPDPYEEALDSRLSEFGMMLYAVRGNHDNTDYINSLRRHPAGGVEVSEAIRLLDGGWVTLADGVRDVVIAGLGGATSSDRKQRRQIEMTSGVTGKIWWPEEVVSRTATLRLISEEAPRHIDVFLSHEGPAEAFREEKLFYRDVRDQLYQPSAICDTQLVAMARRSLRPKAHFFGHHHRRLSLWDGQSDHTEYLECLSQDGSVAGNAVVYDTISERLSGLQIGDYDD